MINPLRQTVALRLLDAISIKLQLEIKIDKLETNICTARSDPIIEIKEIGKRLRVILGQ
ncbi:hypothetical protein [Borrelia sp. P9F1]|uniref:hypothetical protein n=1 Tax=Borrelia sp. P9F1 TaxID=3058374 RepID=UPI002647C9FA|nr:hypothetical protein [Borrelia sp. P9F1]WKC58539.1 hypothetical protein QYZ68_04900 [Borrelia sp. P9F1]WKC58628.1 hypothetical protein QYZ68_05350 [Borrelia sp. P9F1]